MPKYRSKVVEIEAHQWFKNGDHPQDAADRLQHEGVPECEGAIVRYYRHPDVPCTTICKHEHCQKIMHFHGWIDTLEGGHIVCPGDFIVTGLKNEHYPVKPDIFVMKYEPV